MLGNVDNPFHNTLRRLAERQHEDTSRSRQNRRVDAHLDMLDDTENPFHVMMRRLAERQQHEDTSRSRQDPRIKPGSGARPRK